MSLKNKYDYVVIRNNQSLGLSPCAYDYVLKLEQENEKLKLQNFNLREHIIIQKKSLPNKEIKDKSFYNLLDIPTYEELKNQQKEFIKYLEENIDEINFRVILQKYKEIIGDVEDEY